MKTKPIILVILFLTGVLTKTELKCQQQCFTDELHQKKLNKTSATLKHESTETLILDHLLSQESTNRNQDSICTIPVVIHDIYSVSPGLTDSDADQVIIWLNESFANSGSFFHVDGVEIPIQFCLASRDPDGNFTTGLTHTSSFYTNLVTPTQDQDLKNSIRWDTQRYLNIWVVNSIVGAPSNPGVVGYATFPDSHGEDNDGIVVERGYFSTSINNFGVVIHEVGHYLGLYHTFQGGCPNADCLLSGDKVCDTPPDALLYNSNCLDGTNSCTTDDDDTSIQNPFRPTSLGGLGDQGDDQINYMDYSHVDCMERFTLGQRERMTASLQSIRNSLLQDPLICENPCSAPMALNVFNSSLSIEVGESVTFDNNSVGQSNSIWLVDSTVESLDTNFEFSPATQGVYEVMLQLENGEPGCVRDTSYQVSAICPIEIDVQANETFTEIGGVLTFEGTVLGASSFNWFVDGVELGSNSQLSHVFNQQGISQVYIIANNGLCSVQSSIINIAVGVCLSGNENNIWHLPSNSNQTGTTLIDFNNSTLTPEFIAVPDTLVENHASICTSNGQLLFFSDGISVRDANYDLLINGNSLTGHQSSAQGAVFLKNPYNESEYYLFTTDATENMHENGLRYSIIDANGNGGLGVVTSVKNELIIDDIFFEGVKITNHCNGIDKWLIILDSMNSTFYSFLVNSSGPQNTPIVSNINIDSFSIPTLITFSPSGNQFACGDQLYAFDSQTGQVELILDIDIQPEPGQIASIFNSSEFSLAEDVLYVSHFVQYSGSPITAFIRQYDLSLPPPFITTSESVIEEDSAFPNFSYSLKRGPDHKIYAGRKTDVLKRIELPEQLGDDCQFNLIEEFDMPLYGYLVFDNSFSGYTTGKNLFITGPNKVCTGSEELFEINLSCFQFPLEWEFYGDGEFSILSNGIVKGQFNEAGNSTIIVSSETNCGLISDTLHIEAIEAPLFDAGPDRGYCEGDTSVTIELPLGFETYNWSTGDTGQVVTLPAIVGDVSILASYNGCHQIDDFSIIGELEEIDLGPDFDLCNGQVNVLDAGIGYTNYEWHDGMTGQTYTAFLGGYHFVTATDPCFSTDTVYIDDCSQTLNIDELDLSIGLNIFPNPSDGKLKIEFTSSRFVDCKVKVFDVIGKEVPFELNTNDSVSMTIDLSMNQSGSYLIGIEHEQGMLVRRISLIKTNY